MEEPVLTWAEEQITFLAVIGLAITQWAHVENGLFNVNVIAFSECPHAVIGASFHAIENFRAKLAFTDQAVRQSAHYSSLLPEWAEIRDHIQSLSTARNKIAHCRTITYTTAPVGRRYAIEPIGYDKPPKKANPGLPSSAAFCVRDIDLASRRFSRASQLLFGLMAKAQGQEWLPREHVPQEPKLRSLAEIRSLIDVAHLQRGESSPQSA